MGHSLDILIADDDVDNGLSLGELLDLEGHRSCVVHSTEAAIAAFVGGHFDVSFIDVQLPGHTGVESFLKIRKLRPSAKVFMMTGASIPELMKQSSCSGPLGVLSKPLQPEAVVNLVREVGENGVVVAPRVAEGYAELLSASMSAAGVSCQIVDRFDALRPERLQGVPLILDFNASLIDTVEYYSTLRNVRTLPPTVIIAGAEPVALTEQPALRDMTVTGVLNKPFDPAVLLDRLNQQAGTLP
jgi:CheY-like chemotaxis protein